MTNKNDYMMDTETTIINDDVNYVQCDSWGMNFNYPWTVSYYNVKSAREQVQDEILNKMSEAVEADDLKKVKELIKLAKQIKEL
jgi:hypothetical protein